MKWSKLKVNQEQLILTTKEFVEMFGNEKQKASFAKNGKLAKNTRDAIINKATTEWENVEHVKNPNGGRGKVFMLNGKLSEKRDINEIYNYANCGNREQLPFKELLEQIIYTYLIGDGAMTNITYRALAKETKVMSENIFLASKHTSAEDKRNYFESKIKGTDFARNGQKTFWDVVDTESQALIRFVKSVVKDMQNKQIIRYMDVVNGVTLDENNREVHNPVAIKEMYEIDMVKQHLREKHNITNQDLRYRNKSQNVRDYKAEEYKYLKSLGYEYTYDAILIYFIATDVEIKDYIKSKAMQQFMEDYLKHSSKKVEERQENRIIKLINEIGGRRKPKHVKTEAQKYMETLTLMQK